MYRLRVVGSIAITAAYVAAGRFDGMISLRRCRSVDAAAAQLDRPRGRGVWSPSAIWRSRRPPLDLDARYPIAAAAGERGLATAARRAVAAPVRRNRLAEGG